MSTRKYPGDFINKIICGDCLEVMKDMPDKCVDLVLTDPPYLNLSNKQTIRFNQGVALGKNKSTTIGDEWEASLEWTTEIKRVSKYGVISFCSWQFVGELKEALGGTCVGLITWFKENTMPSMNNRPRYQTELIWLIEYEPKITWRGIKTFYNIKRLTAGCMASKERILNIRDTKAAHPTQKPITLFIELIEKLTEEGWLILDPFLGSGTTSEACKLLHRNFIGIEINPDYCKIAEERLAQGVL